MFAAFIVFMLLLFAVGSIIVEELGTQIVCAFAAAGLFVVLLGTTGGGKQIPQRDELRVMVKECERNMPRTQHCKLVAIPAVAE